MIQQNTPRILVLGASGFVGQTVFLYVSLYFPTFGTSQHTPNKNYYLFRTKNALNDFAAINKKVKITHVINCIGLYDETEEEKMREVNEYFPHELEKMIKMYKFTLIHISTDAVFGKKQGRVVENDTPLPDSRYGKSKLAGETTHPKALTIRTSFIGKDAKNKKGIIESVLAVKQIDGYSNQVWSGCTTLQFAKLCQLLFDRKTFEQLRDKSSFIHFVPLPRIKKYRLIEKIAKAAHKTIVVKRIEKDEITRSLDSLYRYEFPFNQFSTTYPKALSEILK